MSNEKIEYKAFMSYAHSNDKHSKGKIKKLCELISEEFQDKTGKEFPIFFDRNNIHWGEEWKKSINEAIHQTIYFIPIITPSFFESKNCCEELETFLEIERKLGRNDLILPVYFIELPFWGNEKKWKTAPLADIISQRQRIDLRELRFKDLDSDESRKAISDKLSKFIIGYLRKNSIRGKQENEIEFGLKELHKIICLLNNLRVMTGNNDPPKKQNIYHKHNIHIEIPSGWGICLDRENNGNATIIKTDGMSLIEINKLKIPGSSLNQIIKNQLTANVLNQGKNIKNWENVYKSSPWEVVNGLWQHYLTRSPIISKKAEITGSGSGLFKPDGAWAAYATNYKANNNIPLEWLLVWIRPEYKEVFMGVHALFPPNFSNIYKMKNIGRGGGALFDYFWPEPFSKIMSTLKTDWTSGVKDKL